MEKTLNELKPGEKGSVMRVTAVGLIRRRLFDMGVTPGAVVMMRKAAPFGDPLEVTLRGYELSLRKVEAAGVLLEVLS
ncbi:MAG: ferrous iron transport protein A [Clostridiales bacterium]|nr:ferrous iron transport protein A [Clostridiales bacterium]